MTIVWRSAVMLAVVSVLSAAVAAQAQPGPKVARVGFLFPGSLAAPETQASLDAFRQGLREHGYVEGQSIVVEYRAADGRIERLPGLAAELTRLNVALIVATTTPGVRAAQQATTTIPIVGVNMGDPVRDGLVARLARPGGNVTGTMFLGPELPGAFGEHTMRDTFKDADASARALGLQLRRVEVRGADDFDHAFSTMTRERADAVFVFPSTMLFTERKRLVALAARHRVPLLGNAREFAQLGGFMSYGASIPEGARRSAAYLDKILKGAKPGELPVEQPTKFELVIDLKTAKALGLSVPPALLLRADQVIED